MLENSTTSSKKAILENYAIKKKSKIFHIQNASGVHEESCAADLSSPSRHLKNRQSFIDGLKRAF